MFLQTPEHPGIGFPPLLLDALALPRAGIGRGRNEAGAGVVSSRAWACPKSRTSGESEAEWERLRLVVEHRLEEGAWQSFVYDVVNCEVLYTAKRISSEDAKLAAVEFA